MEKVSKRKQNVLDTLDEQIEELEEKLAKVQPLINELNQLKRTRAVLLDERSPTGGRGGGRNGSVLSLEQVIHDLRENGPSNAVEISNRLGVDHTAVRSHLNRYRDKRYEQNDNRQWRLIGEQAEEEDDE